jgi:hypothetical protein
MKNNTYRRRSKTVPTVKKSHATIPAAWRRRNPRQVVLAHLGAGSSPWRRMVVRIAVAETHAKAQQLALDALIPPAGVLSGEADDQPLEIRIMRSSPVSATREDPRPGDQVAVPAR